MLYLLDTAICCYRRATGVLVMAKPGHVLLLQMKENASLLCDTLCQRNNLVGLFAYARLRWVFFRDDPLSSMSFFSKYSEMIWKSAGLGNTHTCIQNFPFPPKTKDLSHQVLLTVPGLCFPQNKEQTSIFNLMYTPQHTRITYPLSFSLQGLS